MTEHSNQKTFNGVTVWHEDSMYFVEKDDKLIWFLGSEETDKIVEYVREHPSTGLYNAVPAGADTIVTSGLLREFNAAFAGLDISVASQDQLTERKNLALKNLGL